jgi:hypothetical protein
LLVEILVGKCCFTRTNTHDIELEATLQQLSLNLRGDTIKTDMTVRENSGLSRSWGGSGSHCREDIKKKKKLNERKYPKKTATPKS